MHTRSAPVAFTTGPTRHWLDPAPTPADRLPATARARLDALKEQAADLHALYERASAEWRLAFNDTTSPRNMLRSVREDGVTRREDDPTLIAAEAAVARAQEKAKRANDRMNERAARWEATRGAIEKAEAWLASLPADLVLEDCPFPAVKLGKAEAPAAALERVREERAQLMADAHAVRCAPILKAEAHARIEAEVEALAERGKPAVYSLLESGAEIAWPTEPVRSDLFASVDVEGEARRVMGTALAQVPDALALFVWLNKGAVIKALKADVEALADDTVALSPADRAAKLADIAAKVEQSERQEVAIIASAPDVLTYRADTDPRALLGVIGPAPRA